ncbi:hypothetical protein EV702DRAFT_1101342 [Suillus placidus]|uniref:DUF6532 domain-containing protein n=1 Tax=Suillus placidus TaxID=48579 RepID=A0A9P7D2W0_9AGAM|nr:hypothetical protein EV702DRAFT_1101342 [Suillus placidus]
MSLDDDDGLQRARRHPRRSANSVNAKAIGFYDVKDKANIYQARKLLVINMILETGWAQNHEKLETEGITQECISQACAATKHVTAPTDGVMSLVFDELANIRGKLVLAAEGCLPDLGIDPKEMADEALQHRVSIILDETNLCEYFLNGWDPVRAKVLMFSSPAFFRLHREFWFGRNSPFLDPKWEALVLPLSWYMYGLTGAALLCVIRRASESRLSGVKNVLQFTTEEFHPFALEVQKAMKNYETHPEIDEGEFMPRMNAHHDEYLKELRRNKGELSSMKKYKICHPMAPPSASSSNSIPSLTSEYPGDSVSSSSSSIASWYPGHAEVAHDPPTHAEPAMLPSPYYAPCHAGDLQGDFRSGDLQGDFRSGDLQGAFNQYNAETLQPQPPYYPPSSLQPDLVGESRNDFTMDQFYFQGSSAGWGANDAGTGWRGAP